VAPARAELELGEPLDVAKVTVVEAGTVGSIGRANALGIRRATAPIVALAEDHSFPDPDWAEHLIRAHAGPWTAVGPAVRNANPRTAVSWADLFIGYGPWLEPVPAGEVEFLPGHNTSYRRETLLALGDRLDPMMETETLLHWELRAAGHRLYLEPAARIAHTNFSRWSSWVPAQYHNGRAFAGARRAGMTLWKRAGYVVGAPLIPLVRLARLARTARGVTLRRRFVRCFPALVIGLGIDGLGQLVGYALGPGSSPRRLARYEFHRARHLTPRDRREVFEGG